LPLEHCTGHDDLDTMKRTLPLLVVCLLFAPCLARADAIVFTQAMKASTIAEIFILDDTVRVELEIGVQDLDGFRNVMPDPIYERLGYDPEPLVRRVPRFLAEDWVIRADGAPVDGRITRILPRPRVQRDEITGEPIPADDDDPELVVFVELVYGLSRHPKTLSIRPPGADGFVQASIGFVVYHFGLPVTDFRYLGEEETVDLDWDDPWYSRFRNRNLKRRYDAPMSAFLYVEPYEVRKEVIVRPKDLQQWIDLGLEGEETIAVAEQEEIKRKVVGFLSGQSPVTIDGVTPEPVLDRVHFVRRTLRRTGVIDPPEDLPVISATLGVIFVYPIDSLPDHVSMSWQLFGGKIQTVPSVATDEAGGLPYMLTPGDSILTWQNFLTNPTTRALVSITAAPRTGRLPVPLLSVMCVVLFVGILVRYARAGERPRWLAGAVGILAIVAVVMWPQARVAVPVPFVKMSAVSPDDATSIVSGLLTNVYRAFDFRDESDIYDSLARSASGDLLTEIYLETRKALEVQNQGGARVKVDEVSMLAVDPDALAKEIGFTARCTWNVTGSVGHWGHIHKRTNQYDAVFTVKSVDGVWKITDLELLQEQRLS
jgi:hypothetical protein